MSRYTGKIKVVCEHKMCFPADPETLQPEAVSCYDTHPDHEPDALEVISKFEWLERLSGKRAKR